MGWWMISLLLLLAGSLATVAVVSLLVLLKLQGQWMRAFGQQHGVQLSMEDEEAEEEPAAPPKPKVRVSVPLPGADWLREVRKGSVEE